MIKNTWMVQKDLDSSQLSQKKKKKNKKRKTKEL
jgi:hypothetical protein